MHINRTSYLVLHYPHHTPFEYPGWTACLPGRGDQKEGGGEGGEEGREEEGETARRTWWDGMGWMERRCDGRWRAGSGVLWEEDRDI